jgi:hypothetical protein
MSLFCLDYDTQKWTMVSFAGVAITLTIGLVLHYADGQVSDRPNPVRELMQNGITTPDNKIVMIIPPSAELIKTANKIDEFNIILDYCYQHADSPNPVQDLVDKGVVSSEFNGGTCAGVKQASDNTLKVTLNFTNHMIQRYQECTDKPNSSPYDCGRSLGQPE